jgi:hypothetical protein
MSFMPTQTVIRSGCLTKAGQLVLEHIADSTAADRRGGVLKAGMEGIEHRGEPVGEADEFAGIVSVP